MKYLSPFYILFALLLISSVWSASHETNEFKEETAQSFEKDATVSLQESYRPRHKFKAGTGHQSFSKRSATRNTNGETGLQCAVMYKNHKPVGILQPYADSYKFLPVDEKPTLIDINPNKRKTVMDVLYPSEAEANSEEELGFSDEKHPSLKFKRDRSLDPKRNLKRSLIEEETDETDEYASLMGNYPNRNVERNAEDENLETGANKIELLKERTKNDVSDKTNTFGNTDAKIISGESGDAEEENGNSCNKVESELRKKRTSKLEESSDGNSLVKDDIDQQEDLIEYSKRVERDIRDKINKLKEEVWKEVNQLKTTSKDKNQPTTDDAQRRKRQVMNTLLDEEIKAIDPLLNDDEDEKVHIRRKRSLLFDDFGTTADGTNISSNSTSTSK